MRKQTPQGELHEVVFSDYVAIYVMLTNAIASSHFWYKLKTIKEIIKH